jgi:hypothetical protein
MKIGRRLNEDGTRKDPAASTLKGLALKRRLRTVGDGNWAVTPDCGRRNRRQRQIPALIDLCRQSQHDILLLVYTK